MMIWSADVEAQSSHWQLLGESKLTWQLDATRVAVLWTLLRLGIRAQDCGPPCIKPVSFSVGEDGRRQSGVIWKQFCLNVFLFYSSIRHPLRSRQARTMEILMTCLLVELCLSIKCLESSNMYCSCRSTHILRLWWTGTTLIVELVYS